MGTGGAESLVVEMVRRGRERGWESGIASAGGSREEELVGASLAQVHRVPLSRRRPGGLIAAVAATRRALVVHEPDVVVAHNVSATATTVAATRTVRRRPPVVTVFHGVAEADYRLSARLLSRLPDAAVAVSAAVADRLVAAGMRQRPRVIRNAVSTPVLPSRDDARRALGLPADARVALCAARLVPQKRHDVLLDAWDRVGAGAILLLAGSGPLQDQVTRRAARVGGTVRVLGARSDVPLLLAAADVAVLASDWEGLPVFVLEAMAAGRPVVATDVDGLREVLGGGGGRLVPPRDPAALGRALVELLDDPVLRDVESASARDVIERHYAPEVMMDQYASVLDEVLVERKNLAGVSSS